MGAWRFLLDENVDPKTATYLEKEGVYVEHVRDALGKSADDEVYGCPRVTRLDVAKRHPTSNRAIRDDLVDLGV